VVGCPEIFLAQAGYFRIAGNASGTPDCGSNELEKRIGDFAWSRRLSRAMDIS
jgi:hypothetical protein